MCVFLNYGALPDIVYYLHFYRFALFQVLVQIIYLAGFKSLFLIIIRSFAEITTLILEKTESIGENSK